MYIYKLYCKRIYTYNCLHYASLRVNKLNTSLEKKCIFC